MTGTHSRYLTKFRELLQACNIEELQEMIDHLTLKFQKENEELHI